MGKSTRNKAEEQVQRYVNSLTSVGEICMHWSSVEQYAEILIWFLLDLDEQTGRTVTSPIDIRGRLRLLNRLGKQKLKPRHPARAKIDHARSLVLDVEDDRNLIVHGTWVFEFPGMVMSATKWRGKYSGISKAIDEGLFRKVRASLLEAIMNLNHAHMILRDERQASQEKQP